MPGHGVSGLQTLKGLWPAANSRYLPDGTFEALPLELPAQVNVNRIPEH